MRQEDTAELCPDTPEVVALKASVADLTYRLDIVQAALFIAAKEIASRTKMVGVQLVVLTKTTMVSLLQDAKNRIEKEKQNEVGKVAAAGAVQTIGNERRTET